jgi:hypothetical protein
MEYLAFASQLQLPHWLIIAGVALVLFGAIGILVRRPTDSQVAPEPSQLDEAED